MNFRSIQIKTHLSIYICIVAYGERAQLSMSKQHIVLNVRGSHSAFLGVRSKYTMSLCKKAKELVFFFSRTILFLTTIYNENLYK